MTQAAPKTKKYMLFFGSLRKNSKRGYNFNRFGGQTYLMTLPIQGYELYSLGAYPAICKGEGTITCELHEVEEKAFNYISGMEKGAGYHEEQLEVELNGEKIKASIWMMDAKRLRGMQKVETGDWN